MGPLENAAFEMQFSEILWQKCRMQENLQPMRKSWEKKLFIFAQKVLCRLSIRDSLFKKKRLSSAFYIFWYPADLYCVLECFLFACIQDRKAHFPQDLFTLDTEN